jgi:predicted transcriptional regulator
MADKEHKDLKFLLGDYGLSILYSIAKGATTIETIKIISGVPLSCIQGRIPVLLELGLIKKEAEEFVLSKKGKELKNKLQGNESL